MAEILANLQSVMHEAFPWVVFLGMLWIVGRVVNALNLALERQQAILPKPPLPAPPPPPIIQATPIAPPAVAPVLPAKVIDPGLIAAVKKLEGFSAKAYSDFKQFSIGYGTKANSPTEVITEPEAEARLAAELAVADGYVESFAPGAPIGVKQALTSLTYNAGPVWQRQELGTLIKAGNYAQAKDHFLAYNHAGGQVNAGLTTRRETEWSWVDHPL